MAITVVHKKQTGAGATAVLNEAGGFVKPTAGNVLCAFISQTSTEAAPTLTGWAVNATSAQTTSATSREYFAIKEASGAETEIAPTPGAGGAIQGISYVELAGATTVIDAIFAASKLAKATNGAVQEVTTTTANCMLLCGFARGAGAFGAIKAWAGERKLTNVEETSTRCMSGYEVLTGTVTNAILNAEWTTEANPCGLAVAIRPASEGEHASRTCGDTISVSDAATRLAAQARTAADTVSVSESSGATSAHPRAVADTVVVSESASRASIALARAAGDVVPIGESVARVAAFSRTSADTVTISESATGQKTILRLAGDTVTLSDAAARSALVYGRTAGDSVALASSAAQTSTHGRSVADVITLSESITATVQHEEAAALTWAFGGAAIHVPAYGGVAVQTPAYGGAKVLVHASGGATL